MNSEEFTEHRRIEEERRLTLIDGKLADLERNVKSIKDDVSDLVAAWKAASFILSVIKGLGAVAAAIGAFLYLTKGGK